MKFNILIALLLSSFIATVSKAQNKGEGMDRQTVKEYMYNETKTLNVPEIKNIEAVKRVLEKYKNALEKLEFTGTERFFTKDSRVYESGGSEGTYMHYMEHHLIPEFKDFKAFTFSDYKTEVKLEGNYAFSSETYMYTIILAKDNKEVKLHGITTSVLKKENGQWRIMISHNSSRR